MKVVINRCFGGFSISLDAARYMAERGHAQAAAEVAQYENEVRWFEFREQHGRWPDDVPEERRRSSSYRTRPWFYGYGYTEEHNGYQRDDPLLVEAVEKLGSEANGSCANLVVVEIPDGVSWEIDEYDGLEHVAESHRTWS